MPELFDSWGVRWSTGIKYLIALIKDGLCIIQSSSNPHIIYHSIPSIDSSVKYLESIAKDKTNDYLMFQECVYPSRHYLLAHRNLSETAPYERRLALGEPQLKPIYFDFKVLQPYLDDPMFNLTLKDYYGSLEYSIENDSKVDKAGYYSLKTFGIGYDELGNRVIVSFARYLKNLSVSQQNHWEANESMKEAKVLKPYWDNVVYGSWHFPHSLASGVLIERNYVNYLWKEIFGKDLFKHAYTISQLPADYSFLFIPTKKAFNEFIHTLDKIFSDDIDVKSIRSYLEKGNQNLPSYKETVPENIGSLKALQLWIDNIYTLQNGDKIGSEIVGPLKQIRQLRNPQAHTILMENKVDTAIYAQQNQIFSDIYDALVKFRTFLSTHPKVICLPKPEWYSDNVFSI